jgi:hypothetical protein
MNQSRHEARQTILGFFKRDIALIRATGTPEQLAELPVVEAALAQIEDASVVSFAEQAEPAAVTQEATR